MKLPWRKRQEAAENIAVRAEERLQETETHWDEAMDLAARSRKQREMNGWTGHVLDVFSGHAK